jgi:hypothetical protein
MYAGAHFGLTVCGFTPILLHFREPTAGLL